MEILRRSDNPLVAVVSPSPSNPSSPLPSAEASPQPIGARWGDAASARRYPAPRRIADRRFHPGARRRAGTRDVDPDGPGAAGDLYVSIPATDGTVLGRLDATGAPAPGWPVFLPGSESCDQLLPVASGSVRLICHRPASEEGLGGMITRVHAFDSNGQPLPGWPIEIDDVVIGRMVRDDLMLLVKPYVGDVSETDTPEQVFLGIVAADGTLAQGAEVQFECCEHSWAIGPDGIGYGTTHRDWDTSVKTDIEGFGTDGLRAGWPITIDGNVSELAFDGQGRVYAVVGSPDAEPARTIVWTATGGRCSGSSDQAIVSTSPGRAPDAGYPGAPIVGPDGTAFIVETRPTRRSASYALDPSGQRVAGWPYDSDLGAPGDGFLRAGDTGCGGFRAAPAIGPGNVLLSRPWRREAPPAAEASLRSGGMAASSTVGR